MLYKSWKHKSQSTGQIQAELTQAIGKNIPFKIYKVIKSTLNVE